jgi:hypothetical protein
MSNCTVPYANLRPVSTLWNFLPQPIPQKRSGGFRRVCLATMFLKCAIRSKLCSLSAGTDTLSRIDHGKPRPPQQHRDWFDYAHGGILLLTFLAALAAAIFTARQAYLANKQLTAARDALKISEETAKRQLRAYMFYVGAGISQDAGNPTAYIASIDIKNWGQTPAFNVYSWINAAVGEYPLRSNLVMATPADENSDVGPGAGFRMEYIIQPTLTDQDLNDIRSGGKRIYVWGTIRYTDTFNQPHYTEFRLRSDRQVGPGSWQLRTVNVGRNAD